MVQTPDPAHTRCTAALMVHYLICITLKFAHPHLPRTRGCNQNNACRKEEKNKCSRDSHIPYPGLVQIGQIRQKKRNSSSWCTVPHSQAGPSVAVYMLCLRAGGQYSSTSTRDAKRLFHPFWPNNTCPKFWSCADSGRLMSYYYYNRIQLCPSTLCKVC